MTTATRTQAVTVPATTSVTAPAAVDFDTRLALASAGMDAIHAHRHGTTLAEARAAVATAYETPELLDPPEPKFKSHPLLAQARKIVEKRGWVQGAFESPTGCVCAGEAIRIAGGGHPLSRSVLDAQEELVNRIAADTGEAGLGITQWNDTHCKSQADVFRLLY